MLCCAWDFPGSQTPRLADDCLQEMKKNAGVVGCWLLVAAEKIAILSEADVTDR
jgi:hypothetical protein